MKNLWLRDGCHNCQHVFVMRCYDSGDELFCNVDNNRPICGSLAMDEQFPSQYRDKNSSPEDYARASDAWDAWSEHRGVRPANICDLYIPKKGWG